MKRFSVVKETDNTQWYSQNTVCVTMENISEPDNCSYVKFSGLKNKKREALNAGTYLRNNTRQYSATFGFKS
jgi:hypothetical protein